MTDLVRNKKGKNGTITQHYLRHPSVWCKPSVKVIPSPFSAPPTVIPHICCIQYTLYFIWESLGSIVFCCAGVRVVQNVP